MKPGTVIVNTAAVAALAFGALATALAQPPEHAPAHGYRAKFSYTYYPGRDIYHAPDRGLWFWMDGGNWRSGMELPVEHRQFTYGGVTVELDTERPYERDSQVRRQHPQQQRR